jgi:hypothetical protein
MNILNKAAKAVPGRWHKGGISDGRGNYCAVGHIINACGMHVVPNEIMQTVNTLASEMSNGKYGHVANFNDDPDTTEEDIITLLEKGAIRLDERL